DGCRKPGILISGSILTHTFAHTLRRVEGDCGPFGIGQLTSSHPPIFFGVGVLFLIQGFDALGGGGVPTMLMELFAGRSYGGRVFGVQRAAAWLLRSSGTGPA